MTDIVGTLFGVLLSMEVSFGDFDGSGDVLFPDFALLANNSGKSATAVGVVPEPNAAMLLLVGTVSLLGR